MEKSEAARRLGVAESDVLRVKEVRGRTYVSLNTGVTKRLLDDGGWEHLEQIPSEDEVKEQEQAEKAEKEQAEKDKKSDEEQGPGVDYANEDANAAVPGGERAKADKRQQSQVLSDTELDQSKLKGDAGTTSRPAAPKNKK